ncbi:helix-turn-helix domain-containing protein [Microbacterium hibisci]|uniref:helix-turn-helix domain-containing protein n=1 Tax=Microbacterium hibisci TaxID=2036000 RepID=UPI0019403DC4|nr:helix-turn-helix domain-containing protein [Microbacterium hibisci]
MTVLLTNGTVLVEEDLRAQAADLLERAADPGRLEFVLAAGGASAADLSPELNSFLVQVLRGLARGRVSVSTLPEELTTTVAAELVGVSRPTLMKLVRSGELPSRSVGSHTRLATADVLALRRRRAQERREALEALRALDDEL